MVSSVTAKGKSWKCDNRILMMTAMAILLGLAVFGFDFSIQWMQVILAFAVGLACQYFWLRRFRALNITIYRQTECAVLSVHKKKRNTFFRWRL